MSGSGTSFLWFELCAWNSQNSKEELYHFRLPKRRSFSFRTIKKNSNKAEARTCEILEILVQFNTGGLICLFSTFDEFSPVFNSAARHGNI
jgi:hypothetical protein